MPMQYIERIIIRQDSRPDTETPLFNEDQVEELFEFEGLLILKHIIKAVQSKTHSTNDYVFVIDTITKLKQEV